MSARVAALLIAACACASAPALPEGSNRDLFVDADARRGGDGSRGRPFAKLSDALAASRDGDTLHLLPGVYAGPFRIERALSIAGPRDAVLTSESGSTVELTAPARFVGLSFRGGVVGARVLADAVFEDVLFLDQGRSSISVERGRTVVAGGRLQLPRTRADKPNQANGIEASAGSEVLVQAASLDGPYRFAIVSRGGSLRVTDTNISGAYVGIGCSQGCDGTVSGSMVEAGAATGIVVGASHLLARDNLIADCEQGVAINKDSVVVLEDNVTHTRDLGISSTAASVEIRHHLHVGPSRSAAIQLIGGTALIIEGAALEPGQVGITMRQGAAEIRGTLVRGARSDGSGDFGDGVFALSPDSLRVVGAILEDNAGTSVTVQNGAAELVAVEGHASGIAGVGAQNHASLRVSGAHLDTRTGPALVAIEGSRIESRFGRLAGAQGTAWADCAAGADVVTAPSGGHACADPPPASR